MDNHNSAIEDIKEKHKAVEENTENHKKRSFEITKLVFCLFFLIYLLFFCFFFCLFLTLKLQD
jgi:hypothetical protein